LEETDCSLAIKARERKVTRGLKGGGGARKSRSEGKKKKKKTKGRRQGVSDRKGENKRKN